MDEDEEEGRGVGKFSLQRCPEDVFGDDDSSAKLYPVTELDPLKVGAGAYLLVSVCWLPWFDWLSLGVGWSRLLVD